MVTVPLTRDEFNAKAAQLQKEQGITLAGDRGEVSKQGVTVSYSYNGEFLTLTVTKKPMIVSVAFCEAKLRGWLG
jgi:hypothetical protein